MAVGSALHLAIASVLGVVLGGMTGLRLLGSMNDPVPEVRAAVFANEDPPAAAPTPIRRPVVVALIDGASGAVLERHVDGGALGDVPWRARLDVGVPSLSRPVYHVLLTGTPQWVSGIRSDDYAPGRADSVPARVRDAGGRVGWALESVNWFDELFGAPEDARVPGVGVDTPEHLAAQLEDRSLSIVHVTRTDHVGHSEGAASVAYDREVASALDLVARMRARVDPRTVWFVGPDHGHLARGGHGGPEAEVRVVTWFALGDGVARRTLSGPTPIGALAPTIAAAMGVPAPRQALEPGLPLLVDETPVESPNASRRRTAAATALGEHQARELRSKLLRGAGLAAAAIAAGWWVGIRRALHAGCLLVACVAAFLAFGPGVTISAIRTQGAFIVHSCAVLAVAATAAWSILRARGARPTDAVWASSAVAIAALVLTRGSLGLSDPSDVGMLLYPASGLLPPAAILGVLLVKGTRWAAAPLMARLELRGRRSSRRAWEPPGA